MAAVPATQAVASTVAGGIVEILVLAVLAGAGVNLPLPLGMCGAGTVVGRHLDEVALELIGPCVLDLERSLIHARQNGPADSYVHVVRVTGAILHHGKAFLCQIQNGPLYGLLVAHAAGGDLHIGAVERCLELARRRVGGRACQVLKGAEGLAVTGPDQRLQRRILRQRKRIVPGKAVDLVIGGERSRAAGVQNGDDLFLAFPGGLGKPLHDVVPLGVDGFKPLQLPHGGIAGEVHLGDPAGHVGDDVLLELVVELAHGRGVGNLCQLLRR